MRLLQADDVAAILQIPKARIYELARRKDIPVSALAIQG